MKAGYRVFAYLGLATLFGSLLYGFRYDPSAPAYNVAFDVGLYLVFAVPHLLMTRSWMKRALWGNRTGSLAERQFYIALTVAMWLLVYWLHRPIPGPFFDAPEWLRYLGTLGFILAIIAFFQGATFDMIDGLLGVPGSAMSHSHGAETPLLTEGSYARVRHPMYRAAFFAGICSVVIHAHAAALLWAAMITATFIGFIPIEERQLIAARGDAYLKYRERTPYRLLHGIW